MGFMPYPARSQLSATDLLEDEGASMKEEASVETIVTVEDLVAHSKAGRDLTAPETLL